MNGREELFKKKLERTFSGILRSTDFDARRRMELNERLCHYCVKCPPYVLVLETAQNADAAIIKNLSSLPRCRVLDISPPSDVYEQYKWLQVPSGYFCFQLIRETAFAIKKEIVFFN